MKNSQDVSISTNGYVPGPLYIPETQDQEDILVYAEYGTGKLKAINLSGIIIWERQLKLSSFINSRICLADFTGDGIDDIIISYMVSTWGTGWISIYRHDGLSLLNKSFNQFSERIGVGDLDKNGRADFAVGYCQPHKIEVYNDVGTLLWSNNSYGWMVNQVAIHDIDDDGFGEVIAMAESASAEPEDVYVYEHTGEFKWYYDTTLSPGCVVHCNFGDITGDDKDDLIFTHFEISFALDSDGNFLWSFDDGTDCQIIDINLDGQNEVIISGDNGLYVLDGEGTILWQKNAKRNYPYTLSTKIAIDICGDEKLEIPSIRDDSLIIYDCQGNVLLYFNETIDPVWNCVQLFNIPTFNSILAWAYIDHIDLYYLVDQTSPSVVINSPNNLETLSQNVNINITINDLNPPTYGNVKATINASIPFTLNLIKYYENNWSIVWDNLTDYSDGFYKISFWVQDSSVNNNLNDTEFVVVYLDNNKIEWTFMVYLDADCNLEPSGILDINEMEEVGSDSNINIVVQIDRHPIYDDSNGNWTNAKRYYITKDSDTNIISSTEIQDLGEIDMGSSSTLQSFIQWARSAYPAEKYALILWDHGSGIMGFPPNHKDSPGGVCIDETDNYNYLTISDLSSVLSSNPVDLLGFDACLMGGTEIHYQLKDFVNIIIASEAKEPGNGYPYNEILSYLKNNPSATSEQLGQQIVLSYNNSYIADYNVTQAAVKSFTSEFIDSLNEFIDALLLSINNQRSEIEASRFASKEFIIDIPNNLHDYIDLYNFTKEISNRCIGSIVSASESLLNNISTIIFQEAHSRFQIGAYGLSIYFPLNEIDYSNNGYTRENKFCLETKWDEFLQVYYNPGYPFAPTNPYPSNGATNVDTSPLLGVYVSDPDEDTMDVSFYNASNNSLIGTVHGVSSGANAFLQLFNLSQGMVYAWYAVANDGSHNTASAIWSFTTNNAPNMPDRIYPSNNAILIGINQKLNVSVFDIDGDSMYVFFYNASDDTLIDIATGVTSGTIASVIWSDLIEGETYGWYVRAYDGVHYTISPTWYFSIAISDLIDGEYNFTFISNTDDFKINVSIAVSNKSLLSYACIKENPTSVSNEDLILFFDITLNDTNNLEGWINITIKYDINIYNNIIVWWFNETANNGLGAWQKISFFDLGNGLIEISVNHLSIFALSEKEIQNADNITVDDDDNDEGGKKEELKLIQVLIINILIIGLIIFAGITLIYLKKEKLREIIGSFKKKLK